MRQRSSKFTSRGQFLIEYAMIVITVAAFIAAITVFVQRALKDKMHRAQDYAAAKIGLDQYEPYYIENTSDTTSVGSNTMQFPGGGAVNVTNGDHTDTDFVRKTCAEDGKCSLP